jgi:CheY-like chemotaxis protein
MQLPDFKYLPIILLSSSVDRASLQKYDGNEVDFRLIKPVKLVDIMMCFTNLSGKGSDRSELPEATVFDEVNQATFTVLVAEDNPTNMFLTRTIINKMAPNAVIREARNGNEAVRLCQSELPDIVFMDVQMPELNGYEATRAIKALPGADTVLIIALTAGNVKGEREKCLEAGMVDFVTKPFVPEAIWEVLERVPQFAKKRRIAGDSEFSAPPAIHANFDLARLRTTYMDDDKFIEELLGLTRQALLENLSDLKSYYKRRDLAGIKSTAHRLKGVARAVFVTELANIALDLEMLVAFDPDSIGQRLDLLSNEIEYLLPVFNQQ